VQGVFVWSNKEFRQGFYSNTPPPSKSEVIGRCGGDEKTRMTTQNRQKSNAKKY